MDEVQEALSAQLAKTTVGDPQVEGVRMGALVGKAQCQDVLRQVEAIEAEAVCVFGNKKSISPVGDNVAMGAFLPPMLMRHDRPHDGQAVHEVEAFGPVSTLMPYKELEEAVALAARGKGSLCCSITTFDRQAAATFVREAAPMHGRILVLDRSVRKRAQDTARPCPCSCMEAPDGPVEAKYGWVAGHQTLHAAHGHSRSSHNTDGNHRATPAGFSASKAKCTCSGSTLRH